MNKEIFYQNDFKDYVNALINSGRVVDSKEIGIAKSMLDNGYDTLSEKQKYVFDEMIKRNPIPVCKGCGIEIPGNEVEFSFENGGLCSVCWNNEEKEKEDDIRFQP